MQEIILLKEDYYYALNELIEFCKPCAISAKAWLALVISFIDATCSSVAAETVSASYATFLLISSIS